MIICSRPTEPPFDELCQSVLAGHEDAAARLFHRAGLARPRVVWTPRDADLSDPRLRAFLAWIAGTNGGAPPDFAGFLDTVPEHLKGSVILARIGPGEAIHYDHFGSDVANQFGDSLLGPIADKMPAFVEAFYCAVFQAARERRQIVLTEHEPPPGIFVQSWQRLVVPLAAESAEMAGFAVMNVASNPLRAGLDAVHDAIFVLSADLQILYANPSAGLLVGAGGSRGRTGEFFEETGIDLPDMDTPEDMLGRGVTEARRSLALRETLLADVEITISAVMNRAQAVYIVVVRPI